MDVELFCSVFIVNSCDLQGEYVGSDTRRGNLMKTSYVFRPSEYEPLDTIFSNPAVLCLHGM